MGTKTPERKKEKRIPKTVRRKNIVIDGKAYVKCPHPDCGYMVEDDDNWGNIPNTRVDEHVKEVHKLVWLRKGKTAGWWSLSKFHHRPD